MKMEGTKNKREERREQGADLVTNHHHIMITNNHTMFIQCFLMLFPRGLSLSPLI